MVALTHVEGLRAHSSVISETADAALLSRPLRSLADIEEIADAMSFLISSKASFITGQTIIVDGGITC